MGLTRIDGRIVIRSSVGPPTEGASPPKAGGHTFESCRSRHQLPFVGGPKYAGRKIPMQLSCNVWAASADDGVVSYGSDSADSRASGFHFDVSLTWLAALRPRNFSSRRRNTGSSWISHCQTVSTFQPRSHSMSFTLTSRALFLSILPCQYSTRDFGRAPLVQR
jgi:hypothetical protein